MAKESQGHKIFLADNPTGRALLQIGVGLPWYSSISNLSVFWLTFLKPGSAILDAVRAFQRFQC
ncbi:MAG: hypothetical protein EBQ73_14330 [Gammaproteobacteria bacterium]|nr:hypothetical protein [Gammaproteobacteria bacterium]